MLNIRSGRFGRAQYDLWRNILIKFSKQIENSFAKIINTKVNSKPCQTAVMELFPQVVTGFRGELRILPYIWDEAFSKNSQKRKSVHYFAKSSISDICQVSENASKLASKVKDVSFLNQFKYQRQRITLY